MNPSSLALVALIMALEPGSMMGAGIFGVIQP
jgi:hypothetical protein